MFKKALDKFLSLRPSQSTGRYPREQKFIKSFFILIIVFFAVFILLLKPQDKPDPYHQIEIGGQIIKVELATTPSEQERGLSGRTNLRANEGMFFVFNKPGKYPFWMKDMNFPIDIIWLNQDSRIVYIERDAQPESYPATFVPEIDSKYVLEVNAGFSEKNNLKVGDSVIFT